MIDVEKVVREYIDTIVHMSLATVSNNKPWVCEVHFVYDEALNLYFGSLPDTRHAQELTVNPSVAGTIVRQHNKDEPPQGGIYFEGQAQSIEHTESDLLRYSTKLERDLEMVRNWFNGQGFCMYKISVTNWAVFGKFEDERKKYELTWGPK